MRQVIYRQQLFEQFVQMTPRPFETPCSFGPFKRAQMSVDLRFVDVSSQFRFDDNRPTITPNCRIRSPVAIPIFGVPDLGVAAKQLNHNSVGNSGGNRRTTLKSEIDSFASVVRYSKITQKCTQ